MSTRLLIMKKIKFGLVLVILFSLFSLASCMENEKTQGNIDSENGQTPFIGDNGNWWIGDKDIGISAQGEQGPQGEKGDTGAQGVDGNGILKIEKTNTKDNVDTYTIYFTDGTTFEFTITNGKDGETSKSQGTFGLDYYPLDDGTLGVKVGKALYLSNIVIPEEYEGKKVTQILDYAFQSCSNLTSIEIPASVESIGDYAFEFCSKLTSITIPESVTSIGDNTFHFCESLTSIEIPASVESIGDYAFEFCSKLTSITIPESVTSIGSFSFFGCARLVEVVNKSSLTIKKGSESNGGIGYYALQIITDEKNSKLYTENDFVLYKESKDSILLISYNGNDTDIVVPSGVTSINSHAFYECSNLRSIEIPASVTSIGEDAFYKCSNLTSIEIPASVTSIGEAAFEDCSSLTNITYNGTKNQWQSITKFDDWNRYTGPYTIHCNDGDISK